MHIMYLFIYLFIYIYLLEELEEDQFLWLIFWRKSDM